MTDGMDGGYDEYLSFEDEQLSLEQYRNTGNCPAHHPDASYRDPKPTECTCKGEVRPDDFEEKLAFDDHQLRVAQELQKKYPPIQPSLTPAQQDRVNPYRQIVGSNWPPQSFDVSDYLFSPPPYPAKPYSMSGIFPEQNKISVSLPKEKAQYLLSSHDDLVRVRVTGRVDVEEYDGRWSEFVFTPGQLRTIYEMLKTIFEKESEEK